MKKIQIRKHFLPSQYKFSHQYCLYLHDVLLGLLVQGERLKLFNTHIPVTKVETNSIRGKTTPELLDWFEANNRKPYVREIYFKEITAHLLSDMCHFIYEALQCSKKAKLTVTFALLRKPFKDNLFYLEWLLADPEEFFRWFEKGDFNEGDASSIKPEKKKVIIKKALSKADYGTFISADLIYGFRYDKKAEYGLEPTFQKANHLITRHPGYRTEKANFNFVFSNDISRLSQWGHLYEILPLLLFHSVLIVEALFTEKIIRIDPNTDVVRYRTIVGLLLWSKSRVRSSPEEHLRIHDLIKELANFPCPNCHYEKVCGKRNLQKFYRKGEMRCPKCGDKINFNKLIVELNENEVREELKSEAVVKVGRGV